MAFVDDRRQEIETAIDTLEIKAAKPGLPLNRDKTRYFTLGDEDEDKYASLSRTV